MTNSFLTRLVHYIICPNDPKPIFHLQASDISHFNSHGYTKSCRKLLAKNPKGTMLNRCLSSSSARGLNFRNPLFSHHFQALSSHSSLSTFFKYNPNSSSLSAQKALKWRKLSFRCRHSEYFEPQQQQNQWASPTNSSFSSQPGIHSNFKLWGFFSPVTP